MSLDKTLDVPNWRFPGSTAPRFGTNGHDPNGAALEGGSTRGASLRHLSSIEGRKAPADTLRELGEAGTLDSVHLEVVCQGHPEDTIVSGTVYEYDATLREIVFAAGISVPVVAVSHWILRPTLSLAARA